MPCEPRPSNISLSERLMRNCDVRWSGPDQTFVDFLGSTFNAYYEWAKKGQAE